MGCIIFQTVKNKSMNLWYQNLIKPQFTPPPQYFPIAWGILYTLMAIAFFIILSKQYSKTKYDAVVLFLIQLIINFTWTYVFFELKQIQLALADVILLFIFLILTMIEFSKLSKLATILLIPYFLQVVYAIYLNAGIVILN